MSLERQEQIATRLAQMPKLHRATYERAIIGRSRKAAMHSFCCECCGYQIQEVYFRTDLGCPLYPYRPRSRVSPVIPESLPEQQESKNSDKEGSNCGK